MNKVNLEYYYSDFTECFFKLQGQKMSHYALIDLKFLLKFFECTTQPHRVDYMWLSSLTLYDSAVFPNVSWQPHIFIKALKYRWLQSIRLCTAEETQAVFQTIIKTLLCFYEIKAYLCGGLTITMETHITMTLISSGQNAAVLPAPFSF